MEYPTGPNFIFELENVRSLGAHEQLLAWAERVFAEPRLIGQSFDVRLFDATRLTSEQEAQLYNDFQGRDSELGMGLVNWRKADLSEVIKVVRAAVAKRYLTISMTRTRIDAIEKINQAEPNPQLRYTRVAIEELQADADRAGCELSYLRARISQMHALEHLLRVLYKEGPQISSRSTEQLLRMLGQSWRGFLRVRAWADQFRNSQQERLRPLPVYEFSPNISGYLLKLTTETRTTVIMRDTARYLFFLLASIDALAQAALPILQGREQLGSNTHWYPVSTLLRAIVEFFHFCNFEMPLFYLDIAIDLDDPAHIYKKDGREWQTDNNEMGVAQTLKRVAAEAALLLAESSPLLECTDMDRLDRLLKYEAANAPAIEQADGRDVQPYSSCGLSEFDMDPAGQRVKFNTAFPLMNGLIEQLVKSQSDFKLLRGSALGGPFETIIGMALLDPRAFDLPANNINGLDRFRFLSQFWRSVGRRRAIAMLGEDYVQNVSAGLQALGQPSPEHPTFLTMKIPAIVVGKEQLLNAITDNSTAERDVLPGLVMADQMRIIDLINITWALADDFMLSLRDMPVFDLKSAVANFPRLVDSYRGELVKRFNEKWLGSMNWVWSMIRGISPMLWDFWSKVGSDRAWDEMIARAPAAAATGLLLRLFCDTVRLVLMLELSESPLAGGLRVSAESASQSVMLGVEHFFLGPNVPSVITESVDYYFDPEIQFDSWLAFVSSYKLFLRRSITDLQQMNAAVDHWQLLEKISNELERLYPTRVVASPPPKQRLTKEYNIGFLDEQPAQADALRLIDENDAMAFYNVCFDMLGNNDYEAPLFLRLITMFRRAQSSDWIYQGAHFKNAIEHLLPEYHYRRLIYGLPSRADSFFRLMKKLEEDGRTSHVALELMQPQVLDYFEQLNDAYTGTLARFAACPRVLPRESADLLATRFAEQKSAERSTHPFLLLLVCDYPIIYLDAWSQDEDYDEARIIKRVQDTLVSSLGAEMDDPLIEISVLGGGQLEISPTRVYLFGSSRTSEPAFIEPDKPYSRLLLSKFVSHKFALTLEVLRLQFPQQQFVVQP